VTTRRGANPVSLLFRRYHSLSGNNIPRLFSAGPLEAVVVKVAFGQAGFEAVVAPGQGRALAGLVIDHFHPAGTPVFVGILAVVVQGEGFSATRPRE
jgi:hypothetical protein